MKFLILPESKKTIILIFLYFFFISVGASILRKYGIMWIQRNLTATVYISLFLIALLLFGEDLIRCIKKIDERGFEQLVIIGFFTLVANVVAGILLSCLNVGNDNQVTLDSMTDHNVILLKLATIIFAPIVEELVYRYGIYGMFKKNHFFGCIIATFLFAFSHVWRFVVMEGKWIQLIAMLPYLAFGLGLNILYQRTKNVIYPIMLHMVINVIGML